MCSCDWNYTCSRCAGLDFGEMTEPAAPLTLAEFDHLIASAQSVTAEPVEWIPTT